MDPRGTFGTAVAAKRAVLNSGGGGPRRGPGGRGSGTSAVLPAHSAEVMARPPESHPFLAAASGPAASAYAEPPLLRSCASAAPAYSATSPPSAGRPAYEAPMSAAEFSPFSQACASPGHRRLNLASDLRLKLAWGLPSPWADPPTNRPEGRRSQALAPLAAQHWALPPTHLTTPPLCRKRSSSIPATAAAQQPFFLGGGSYVWLVKIRKHTPPTLHPGISPRTAPTPTEKMSVLQCQRSAVYEPLVLRRRGPTSLRSPREAGE